MNPYELLHTSLKRKEVGVYRALFNDLHKWKIHWDNAMNSSKKKLDVFESKLFFSFSFFSNFSKESVDDALIKKLKIEGQFAAIKKTFIKKLWML